MLSNCSQFNKTLTTRVIYQLQKTFATAVNVKLEDVKPTETSYVEGIAQEWKSAKPFKQLPGLTRFQLLRGFMKTGEFEGMSLNELMQTCRKRFGDSYIMPASIGQQPTVVTYNIDDFEKVHRTEGAYPIRPGGEAVLHYRRKRKDNFFEVWEGLMGSGEKWAKFRHAVNPVLMKPQNAKLYLEPMQKVNEEFLQRIREIRDSASMEVPDNFIDDINHLTFESVAVVALNKQMGLIRSKQIPLETIELFKNVQIFMKSFYDLGIKPSLYKYIPTPTYIRFQKASDAIFDTCFKYVNEALERIETQKASNAASGGSVLEKLVEVDRKIAMIIAMDMLIGGVDTTSSILTGILLAIAKNPDKQAKLRKEITSVLPNKDDKFTIENMKNLPYLRACIKESMRLYPIIFGNTRETGTDIALSGYRIPKGTRVFMNSNLILKEERYFPRPLEFMPERWLRTEVNNIAVDNPSPFIFLPFGFGPRACVGKRIVELELELTLANLVRNFNIEFNHSTEQAFKNYFINMPAIPLKFKFTDVCK